MKKQLVILFAGILIGSLATLAVPYVGASALHKAAAGDLKKEALTYPVSATLYRFKLNRNTLKTYQEWVQWHHDAYKPMIETLERERMYFESVFRDTVNEPDVIYWLTINAQGGETSNTSDLAIDKKHNEYMRQILVKGSRSVLKTEFTLMPEFIEEAIGQHQKR